VRNQCHGHFKSHEGGEESEGDGQVTTIGLSRNVPGMILGMADVLDALDASEVWVVVRRAAIT
jgi:hypothetical protein